MSTDKKAETKNDPTPTEDEDRGRVTAETVVTEGTEGMARFRRIVRALMPDHPRRQE